jgi:hypothetical protein
MEWFRWMDPYLKSSAGSTGLRLHAMLVSNEHRDSDLSAYFVSASWLRYI